MNFEGDLEVFDNLREKRRLLSLGSADHSHIRPLLLSLWGTMRGVYGGGQVIALEREGFSSVFDVAAGVSTGAPNLAYFLAHQAELGTSIYCEECTTPAFMSLRPLKVDVTYLADVFRGLKGAKALDQKALASSRTKLFAAVTDAQSGVGRLVDVKTAMPDAVQALVASIALPGFTEPIKLGERLYLDGGGGMPFPLREVIAQCNPTDVLVLANRPRESAALGKSISTAATWYATRKLPPAVREAYRTRVMRLNHEVAAFRQHAMPCRVGILWSDSVVGSYERRPEVLRSARDRADAHLTKLLRS